MANEVLMPQLSDTMKSGKIISWKKKKGDPVSRGDILAEVETEKANLEIEAFQSGILLDISIEAGENATVGERIAVIGQAGESVSAPTQKSSTPTVSDIKPAVSSSSSNSAHTSSHTPHGSFNGNGKVKASPLARKLAEEKNLNLSNLKGSGPDGRIVKRDIESASSQGQSTPTIKQESRLFVPRAQSASGPVTGKMLPLSKMRETIARRMQESVSENPHFYVTTAINMSEALRLRETLKKKPGYESVNVNHLVIKAVAYGLKNEPRVNRAYRDNCIFEPDSINIGIITAVEDGLLIPVIREADSLSLKDIAFEAKAAIDRARVGRPTSSDLSGGTFSISNMGMFDVENFTAIINPGQGGVIAISSVKETPIAENGYMKIAHIMKATVSVDHRVIDGVMAATFLKFFKEALETPMLMLLD